MRIEAGPLRVDADATGRIVDVTPGRRPTRPGFLTAVDLGVCRVAGAEVAWASRDVAVDADEIEIQVAGGGLEVTLRHGFSTGWTTRLLVVNTGPDPAVVERLQLIVRPAGERRVSAQAVGSRLCWAVQASSGDGPVLAARLLAGAISRVTPEGLELGPLRLAPGQRYVTQLRWELFATPRSVVAGPGRDVLLTRSTYEVDEGALLPNDPDAALVTPPGVEVDAVEEAELTGREVSAAAPGRHRIELRSADGDLRFDLSWVLPLADQLQVWATSVLARPRTAAGVVTVDDLPAAVVLQAAWGAGGLPDADEAADALDRLTAHLLDGETETASAGDPLEVLYLLGEHGRTGDDDVFAAALMRESALLASSGPPPPGLGLAVLRTVLAGVDSPELVAPLVAEAVRRARALVAEVDLGVGREPAAELELLLAVRPLLPADEITEQRLQGLVRAAGSTLGAGLPGRLLEPPPVVEHAHLLAVLRMLPEDGLPRVTGAWGASPNLLTRRWTLDVLDRLAPAPRDPPAEDVGPAAAWLALAQRPG